VWLRVFGRSDAAPSPAKFVEHLAKAGLAIVPHFKGDDLGWTSGELMIPRGSPVMLNRYLTVEDDLRDDLNAFAAELETLNHEPNHQVLMERVIQTKQMIVLRKPADAPDEVFLENLLTTSCRWLAAATDGVYQVDNDGWYAPDGTQLLKEY
jgi:hypothetical protein